MSQEISSSYGNLRGILNIMNIHPFENEESEILLEPKEQKLSEAIASGVKNTETVQNTSYWMTAGKIASQCLRPVTWVKEKIKPVVNYVARPVCNYVVNNAPRALDGALYMVSVLASDGLDHPMGPIGFSSHTYEDITRERQELTEGVKNWLKDGHNLRLIEESLLKNVTLLKHFTGLDRMPKDVLQTALKASAAAALSGAFFHMTGIADPAIFPYMILGSMSALFGGSMGALLTLGSTSKDFSDRLVKQLGFMTPAELMTKNLNDSLKGVVEKRMVELIENSHPLRSLVKGITQKYPVHELIERILLQDSQMIEQRMDTALQTSMLGTLDDLENEFKELIEVLQENRLALISDGVFRTAEQIDHQKLIVEVLSEVIAMVGSGKSAKYLFQGAAWATGINAITIAGDPLDWVAKMIFTPPQGDAGLLASLFYEIKKDAFIMSTTAGVKFTPVARSVLNDVSRLHSQGAQKIEEISKLKGKVNSLLNMLGFSRSSLAQLITDGKENEIIIEMPDEDSSISEKSGITPEEKLYSALSEAVLGLDVTTETDPQVAAFLARSFDLIFPVFVGFLGEVGYELGKDDRFSSLRGALSFAIACMRKPSEPVVKTNKKSVLELLPRPSSGNLQDLSAKSKQLFVAALRQFYCHLSHEVSIQMKLELERQKQGVKDSLKVWNQGVDNYYKAQGEMLEQMGVNESLASSVVSFLSYPNRKGRELISMLLSPKAEELKPIIIQEKQEMLMIEEVKENVPEDAEQEAIAMFREVYKNLGDLEKSSLEKDINSLFESDVSDVPALFAKLLEVNHSDEHYTKKVLAVMLATKFTSLDIDSNDKLSQGDFQSLFNKLLHEYEKIEAHIERYHAIRKAINIQVDGLGGWTAAANLAAPNCQAMLEKQMIKLITRECAPLPNKAGGDCLPLSFIQSTGAQIEVDQLRKDIAEHMWNNRNTYREIVRKFLEASRHEFDEEMFRQYLSVAVKAEVILPGTSSNYLGSPELQALCDMSASNIVLVGKRGKESYLMIFRPKLCKAINPTIFLRYTDSAIEGARHYEAYQHNSIFEAQFNKQLEEKGLRKRNVKIEVDNK